ncbi:hypothetical protein [Leptospira sarikeiensis]|uniref:Uncharacterized protein n=1 Tax=Leptospira sarikeiensis TaxID=2484943 RepID=A0A4R9KBR3_9LEPT|nr:hypothetical protein [Leptospira sarikeiensis]TGL63305.1 hypothetical protein EHQ64_04910 [Leptospira sarikeiensis]
MEPRKDYDYLIKEFTEEKIKDRFIYLCELAKKIIRQQKLESFCSVESDLISEVVIDYFSDIDRLKKFHGLKKANTFKIAAYTAYWILRRKPIQIKGDINSADSVTKAKIRDINEIFAKSLALGIIYDFRKQVDPGMEATSKLVNFYVHLNYHFVYRQPNPQSLELAFTAFDVFCPFYELSKESGD